MTSIDNADMYGNLTRVAMAKMVANYVLDLGLQELDTDKECNFPDVSASLDEAYDNGVTKACQLGLMGVGIEKFNPNGIVTRAEFGTVLSRALWGDEYNGADPYYKDHLQALKDEGIMNMIDNPNMKEVRGYVMLMMMRADDAYTPTTGCSAEELLACIIADDYETCIAACSGTEEEVVKSGDLAVTAKENEGVSAVVGSPSELDYLTFKASERITLNKVTLELHGYSNGNDVANVWLEDENGDIVTNEKGLTTKDQVTLTLKKDYRDLKEATFVTVLELKDDAAISGGVTSSTVGFKVIDVESSAKNLNVSKYTPATYKVVRYEGTDIDLEAKGQNRKYYYAPETSYEVGRLQVKAKNAAIEVNGFTFENNGGFELKDFASKVEVTRDGKPLSNQSWTIDRDGELKISFAKDTIEAKKNALYVFNMNFDELDKFGEGIELQFVNINAVEAKNNVRVTPNRVGKNATPAEDLLLKEYVIHGDKVVLSKGTLDSTVYAKAGDTDVVIAEGTITLGEAVKFKKVVIPQGSGWVTNMKIVVSGDEYDGKLNTSTKNFEFTNVVVEKTGKFQLLVDIDEDLATEESHKFVSITKNVLGTAVYDEYSSQTVDSIQGSIDGATLRVEGFKGTLKNNISKQVEVKEEETPENKVVLFDGEYTAKRGNAFLNEATISLVGGSFDSDSYADFFLTIGGEEVSLYMDNSDSSVTEYFDDIEVKKGDKVKVKLEAYPNVTNGEYTFKVALGGQDEDGEELDETSANTVKLKAVSQGATIVTEKTRVHYKDTVVKAGSNVELASFIVKTDENSTVNKLESLTFTFPTGISASDIFVYIDGDDYTDDLADLNLPLDSDGVEVVVEYDGATDLNTGTYTTKLLKVNGADKNREYKRNVVKALVTLASQSHNNDGTVFTLNVDKDSEDAIERVRVYVGSYVDVDTGIVGEETYPENGAKLETLGSTNTEWVTAVAYQIAGETNPVVIKKTDYADFFRLSDGQAKVNKSS